MEEHRPKKLLDQVHACPACPERSRGELGEGMPSASNTISIIRSRLTSAGSSAASTSTMCVTRPKWCPELTEGWVLPRCQPFSLTWSSRNTLLLRHRTHVLSEAK
jgi:hypothetical protein